MQMIQLSATRCSCIAILRVSLVSFAAIILCVASQRVFIVVVYFVTTQSGNFWILPRIWRRVGIARSQVTDGGDGFRIRRGPANILNKQS
jgi:hypothetical protein